MFKDIFVLGALAASFIAGLFCNSQTLRDYLKGVPSEVRTALKGLEAKALAAKTATAAASTAAAVAAVTPTVVVAPAKP
jgi:hypothetical protein